MHVVECRWGVSPRLRNLRAVNLVGGPTCVLAMKSAIFAALVATAAAQFPGQGEGGGTPPRESECEAAYRKAYMSALTGDCQAYKGCSTGCQTLIDTVASTCNATKYNESDTVTGIQWERSFVARSLKSLMALGPVDCKYQVTHRNCKPECTMHRITGGEGLSDFELQGCLSVDPASKQSRPQAVWHSCDDGEENKCGRKFEYLADQCKGCTDPALKRFLTDAGRKLARCRTSQGTGHSCETHLASVLDSACCSGPDGEMGTGDDLCSITNHTYPPTCEDDPVCMGATQTAAAVCPNNFTGDPGLMGLFVDCGGHKEQLYAASPVKTNVALFCEDYEEALHHHAHTDDSSSPDSRRRMMIRDAAKHAEDQFKHFDAEEAADVFKKARQLQDDPNLLPPDYPDDPACANAYSDVFTASLFGECSANWRDNSTNSTTGKTACTSGCQTKITTMLKRCKHEETMEHLEDGINVYHSFAQKAANALQYLGGNDCAFQLGYQDCQDVPCRVGSIGTRLQQAGCTTLFLFQDFRNWTGCRAANLDGNLEKQQPKEVQEKCWDLFLNISSTCSGCRDEIIPALLEKAAIGSADSACIPVHAPKYSYCTEVQQVADKIHNLCCAGADGIVGTSDDPCTTHADHDSYTDKDVLWHIPDTCQSNPICSAYVINIAESVCPSTFMDEEIPRRVYSDCGGDIHSLIARGKPCDFEAFKQAEGLEKATRDEPNIRHADWGTCFRNTTKEGRKAGPYLSSGQRCDLTCTTGWCVDGAQPHCMSGKVTMLPNGGGTGGFFDYTPPMECKPAPVSSCKLPPNGGCDPLTDCEEHMINVPGVVNNLMSVTCTDCPSGYIGDGRSGCTDIDECLEDDPKRCDDHTTCTNLDGGYKCSACPVGRTGDSHRFGGCCAAGTTYVERGLTGAECLTCPSDEIVTRTSGEKACGATDFQNFLSMGHGESTGWSLFTIFLVIAGTIGIVACICNACNKKSYKDAGGRFEKVDVGSIGTGPSIYDSSWAR